jgi:hypothetical protein
VAVHVCADLPSRDEHLPRTAVRCARDTLARMVRVCAAAGIEVQHRLAGQEATTGRLREVLTAAVADLDPDGLLVLTFAGHSDRRRRDTEGKPIVRWCLNDGGLAIREVAGLLAALRSTAHLVVVADTCYAGAFAHHGDLAATLILLAACEADQTTLSGPTSDFAVRLETLLSPDGRPHPTRLTYRWLQQHLHEDTPDAERPVVWTNRDTAWTHRPLHIPPPARRQRLTAATHAPEGR